MKRTIILLTALATMIISTPTFAASTATTNLTVSASVAQVCTISAVNIAFAAYDPIVTNLVAPKDANGSVTVKCTKGASGLTIDLSKGTNGASAPANGTTTTRTMKDGVTTNYLDYELYSDAPGGTVWNNGFVIANPGKTGTAYAVYGRIPGGQDAAVSTTGYTDTVVATINY